MKIFQLSLFALTVCLFINCNVQVKKTNSFPDQHDVFSDKENPVTEAEAGFSDRELTTLYNEAYNNCYDYSFVESSELKKYGNYAPGTYISGLKGLFLYCDFPVAVSNLLAAKNITCEQRNGGFYDITKFECLAGGIKMFSHNEEEFNAFGVTRDGKQDFHHYNPKFINWMVDYLIPNPGTPIGPAKSMAINVYQKTFSRFFHMMTESYVYLLENDYDEKVLAYQSNFDDLSFNGMEYLFTHFDNVLPKYNQAYDLTNMTSPMAIGFWLRRKIDGTHDELWLGLTKFMLEYNKGWFKENVNPKHYR